MAEAKYKRMWTFLIESNYADSADIGSDMICTICTRILINAHNSVCGCRYCLDCVKAYLNGERRFCPGNTDDCKAEELDIDSNIYPDHAVNNRISKLILACRYSCGYRCELKNMEEHERVCQRQPLNCPYVNVGCRETRLVCGRINEHLLGDNESHARLLMACIDRLESEIGSMKRDTVELRWEMAEMRLAREIDEARARQTNELVDQIKQELANLKNENRLTKLENNSLKAEIDKYRTEYLGLVAATEQELTEMRAREQSQVREMELLTEKYRRIEEKWGELERQARNGKEELRGKIDEVCKKQASRLDDVEKRLCGIGINAKIQNYGEFVWPIDGWAAKSQSAKDGTCRLILSDPFYSHKNGYKMCLSVCPDGNGSGKGTHLSVFFYLMRGPFDNILSWPFKCAVTLTLIDQYTGIDYVSRTATFDYLPDGPNWKKPSSDRNEAIGYQMIELTELSRNARLCQDDKIFIKCTVK